MPSARALSRWQTRAGTSARPEQREKVRLAVGRGQAAVNREDHAVDEAGVIAGQERDHGRHLVRRGRPADCDRIYGSVVTRRLRAMGIRDKPAAPASPWQNGYAERLIGSIRRECVDLGEAHLRRILRSYADYHNRVRTHRPLDKDAPVRRLVPRTGVINSRAILGGLHHHYARV